MCCVELSIARVKLHAHVKVKKNLKIQNVLFFFLSGGCILTLFKPFLKSVSGKNVPVMCVGLRFYVKFARFIGRRFFLTVAVICNLLCFACRPWAASVS